MSLSADVIVNCQRSTTVLLATFYGAVLAWHGYFSLQAKLTGSNSWQQQGRPFRLTAASVAI